MRVVLFVAVLAAGCGTFTRQEAHRADASWNIATKAVVTEKGAVAQVVDQKVVTKRTVRRTEKAPSGDATSITEWIEDLAADTRTATTVDSAKTSTTDAASAVKSTASSTVASRTDTSFPWLRFMFVGAIVLISVGLILWKQLKARFLP